MQSAITRFDLEPEIVESISGWVEKAPPLTLEQRVEVYSDAWFIRLEESLTEDFPSLREQIGEEPFSELLREYLEANPPSSFSLVDAGLALPEFVTTHLFGRERPWLRDLAVLERAVCLAYYATDSLSIPPSELQKLSPDQTSELRLSFSPSVSLLSLDWDVIPLWDGTACSEFTPADAPCSALIYRRFFEPQVEKLLSETEGALRLAALLLIRDGCTLGELLGRKPDPQIASFCTSGVRCK